MPEKARPWFELSLSKIIDDDSDSKKDKAMITANYGDTFTKNGHGHNFERALNYYNDSLSILSDISNLHPAAAEIYYKIASVYNKKNFTKGIYDKIVSIFHAKKNYTKALDNLANAISIYIDSMNIDNIESLKEAYDLVDEICLKLKNYSDLDLLYNIGKKYLAIVEHNKQKDEHFLMLAFAFIYFSKEEIDDEIIKLFSMLEDVHQNKSNSNDNFSIPFLPWVIFEILNIYSRLAQIYYDLGKIDLCSKFSTQSTFLLWSQKGQTDENVNRFLDRTFSVTPAASKNANEWFGTSIKYIFGKMSLLLKQSKYEEEHLYFAILSNVMASVFFNNGVMDKVDFSNFSEELVIKAITKFHGKAEDEEEENEDENSEKEDFHSSNEHSDKITQENIDTDPLDKLCSVNGTFMSIARRLRYQENSITKGNRMFRRLTGELYTITHGGQYMTISGNF